VVGKSEGNRPLGKLRRRWKENVKMDPTEIIWDGVDWTDLGHDRKKWRAVLDMAVKRRVPKIRRTSPLADKPNLL